MQKLVVGATAHLLSEVLAHKNLNGIFSLRFLLENVNDCYAQNSKLMLFVLS